MEHKGLYPNYYFENVDGFEHSDLFDKTDYAWKAVLKINSYIDNFFQINDTKETEKFGKFSSIEGKCSIGENTNVHSNVVIEGPVIIGKNCDILSGALIRPYSIIGDNCVIGHCAEVKHSIIMNNAKIQSFTFVGDSIIGDSARIGSGTIVANRRFDQKNIGIKYNSEFYDFETDFFGCILGDYARIGANSSTLPGSLIGAYTWIMPMTRVKGFIASEKLVDGNGDSYTIKDKERVKLK